jgi:nitrate/nitrite transporter NarK
LSLLAAAVGQIVSMRFGAARTQTVGLVALGAGMVGLFVVNAVPSLVLLLTVAVTTGVGHGFAFAGSMRELNAAAFTHAPREQGAVIAAMFTVGYLGLAVPSLIAGLAITMQGMSVAIFETAAVGVVLCAALVVVGVRAESDSDRSPVR